MGRDKEPRLRIVRIVRGDSDSLFLVAAFVAALESDLDFSFPTRGNRLLRQDSRCAAS